MAIISAAVESNGWVLSVVVSGSAGGFADYTLDANGAPRALVRSSHAGFEPSGGEAVAATLARAIPATIPLRLPVDSLDPNTPVIDEQASGSDRVVRIALANFVYVTDTSLTLDVLAGWRTGESAATGIAVTNNSTVAAPIPILRWMDLGYQIQTGTFRVALLVTSHHPNGFAPVAGVKFTATDGTTVKTVWTTTLATDTRYGDDLRCYTVEIDPATATALTAGLLRIDAEVYPWLGAMRSTDPAGTKSVTNLRSEGRRSDAAKPQVQAYDPDGTRYSARWVYVDAVNGTTTASSGMIATTLAGAKAIAPASRPANLNTALQASFLANRTLAAANGGSSYARSADGLRIVLAPGVTVAGANAVTFGAQAGEVPVIIMGDPEDADPKANCILRSGTANPGGGYAARLTFQNLTMEVGQANLVNAGGLIFVNNCEVRAKAGFETNVFGITGLSVASIDYSIAAVNTRWWKTGCAMGTSQLRFGLIRNCEFSRTAQGVAIVKSRWIGPDDEFVGPLRAVGMWPYTTDLGGMEDNIHAYNDLRRLRTEAVFLYYATAATAGTTWASLRRYAMFGNVFETFDNIGTTAFFSIGEGAAITASYNIVEGNTFAGERVNAIYNDPPSALDTFNNELLVNRWANNAFEWNATKHDDFLSPNGVIYRPWLTGGWAVQNGVMHEGNYASGRHPAGSLFGRRFAGLRALEESSTTSPGYIDDKSQYGSDVGGGDYTPDAGSPLLGRVLTGNTDRDLFGTERGAFGAAGAFEAQAMGLVLAPVPGDHSMSSPVVGVSVSVGLVPAGARHGHLAGTPGLLAGAALAPESSLLTSRASTTALLLSVGVVPAAAAHVLFSTGPELVAGGLSLVPEGAGHGFGDAGTFLSVPAISSAARRLLVGPDLRTGFARVG